ncbi:hypothetical protein ACFY1P_07330 [Streptomyces sp. NPDC001407]|uniref:hypothetical protein n=1 Tax=unclassified Streptomyces TaxID=2593676 RepID=UPI0033F17875
MENKGGTGGRRVRRRVVFVAAAVGVAVLAPVQAHALGAAPAAVHGSSASTVVGSGMLGGNDGQLPDVQRNPGGNSGATCLVCGTIGGVEGIIGLGNGQPAC